MITFPQASVFRFVDKVEFETWSEAQKLPKKERADWYWQREILERFCNILLIAFRRGEIAFRTKDDKRSLRGILLEICSERDSALLGRTLTAARNFKFTPTKKVRKTLYGKEMRQEIMGLKFSMKMKNPSLTEPDCIKQMKEWFDQYGLKTIVPSQNTILEILRPPRPEKRETKRRT